jgi:hypothetical protein
VCGELGGVLHVDAVAEGGGLQAEVESASWLKREQRQLPRLAGPIAYACASFILKQVGLLL